MIASTEQKERDFHDDWARAIDPARVHVREAFETSTSPEGAWIVSRLGDLRGKRVLELGSGAGEGAVYLAMQGADVTATDLSPEMLRVVQRVAELHGVHVETACCSAEDLTQFEPESFDVVYAANLLHHVDVDKCIEQVLRILKPGGCMASWDPLAHNPAINVYRRIATKVRTADEHPIRKEQMRSFSSRFADVETGFFWLTALLVFVKFYAIDRVHPNEDRYWKRILEREHEIRWLYAPLAKVDRILLRLFPFLRWWCWNIAIVARKATD